jgi:tRNA(Ile)-lysidine synthase
MSLLILADRWARENHIHINCVTVDHQLREESACEAQFVKDFCESRKIDHTTLKWNREKADVELGKLENLAREARYQLISEFCESKNISMLLVGHTWNDQLETFEMRRKRGSYASGLAGMSQIRSLTNRIKLLRPILHFSKDHLKDFLVSQNVSWKIDPMNEEIFFLRVFYRKEIANYDDQKISNISNEIIEFGKERNRIESKAVGFLEKFCEFSLNAENIEHAIIEKKQMLLEEKAVQVEILKRVIWNVGGKKYATTITEDIYEKILRREINTIGRCFIRVKKEKILVFKENRNHKSSGLYWLDQHHKMAFDKFSSNNFSNKVNLFDVFL